MPARNLKNVTVTLEEEVARWARLRAAEENTSVSQLLGRMLRQQMLDTSAYDRAMKRYRTRKPYLHLDGKRPSRDDLHDRAGLR
ncbi:MAG: CopG family transcriptional regulator [Acidobacteriota bacterium]